MAAILTVNHLYKSYHEKKVLEDLSFSLEEGTISAVMAPSGIGKTTLLRILLGLETADSGEILGLEKLRLSAVFQEDRLCENLSPVSNIRLVTGSGVSKKEIQDALCALELADCISQPVRELSGGQRRRVALLRALMAPWDLLLLDEPFKGLDTRTRQTAMDYVLAAFRQAGNSRHILLVTHDQTEADYLAGQIIRL